MESKLEKPLGQPRALYLLALVQMWECFSFYGMRALLVLFMIEKLQFSDIRAFGIYAAYTGLVELGGIVGGMVADNFLGLRRAIFLGGWLIAAGHLTMAFDLGFFLGLALIILGSSLFATNISALLGSFYGQEDPRRESGFTLFYAAINIGALLASLVCGYVGEKYGWHYGFGLAAIGMFIGNIALYLYRPLLEEKGLPPKSLNKKEKLLLFSYALVALALLSMTMQEALFVLPLLPWLSLCCFGYVIHRLFKGGIRSFILCGLALYFGAQVLFFAAEDQIGSSLMVFNERFADKVMGSITFPSSLLLSINPLTIILVGMVGSFWNITQDSANSLQKKTISLNVVLAFLLGGICFSALAFLCSIRESYGSISVGFLVMIVFVISVAELMIGPAVYSFCSKIAPEKEKGLVMGLVPIGFSLASFLGGHLSNIMAFADGDVKQPIALYQEGFALIAYILFGGAICLAIGISLLRYREKFDRRVAL